MSPACATAFSRRISRPLILADWQQRNETFFSALQVERVVMFTILSMIIVVAAFNIISSLVMLVKDKGADIAMLRTMGATQGAIMRIFSMTGTAIGVAGTIVGLILGPVDRNQRRIPARLRLRSARCPHLPARGVLPLLAAVQGEPWRGDLHRRAGPGLSLLATIYPAWRAAQYDPVEALRYE
jgi:lipoprotein-releasing system permease protein